MNIILGVILWSLKKFSRKDKGKMFTARPRRTRTCGQRRDRFVIDWFRDQSSLYINRRSSYDAPDHKRDFKVMGEAEDGEAEESKDAGLWKRNKTKVELMQVNKGNGAGENEELTDHT